jgi:LPS export ABC transporter protein LptC
LNENCKEKRLKSCINQAKKPPFSTRLICLVFIAALTLLTCSFDYGAVQAEGDRPDIIMENIEYVRVRGGNLLARFQAEYAEQWEERQMMGLRDFSFEQMEDRGETVNVEGTAGAAEVQLDSGDILLFDGVKIRIESEDLTIHASEIEWIDNDKALFGREDDIVEVQRSDGTSFTGRGFSAEIRSRTWAFSGEAQGIFVDEDDEEE